jgi:3-methyladenine DNA glycosylase AlkD
MTARDLQARLRELGTPESAAGAARFFKTSEGQYGAGDVFLGIRAADMHKLAKESQRLAHDETTILLRSGVHEDRLLALLILVRAFKIGDETSRKRIVKLYLANTRYVNNWDLVDASARDVLGAYLADRDRSILDQAMPRTTLRYAIERFPEPLRRAYLKGIMND